NAFRPQCADATDVNTFPTRRSSDLKEYWNDARREAWDVMIKDFKLNIVASDIDKEAVELAKENAENLGLEEDIRFIAKDVRDLKDRKSTRLNSSHVSISYAVFCLKK